MIQYIKQMDKKTLLAFSLIAVVLILTPWYMGLVSPTPLESKKVQQRPAKVTAHDASPSQKEATASPILKASKSSINDKEEFVNIQTSLESDDVVDRVFKVVKVNGDVIMAQGHMIEDGIVNTDSPLL